MRSLSSHPGALARAAALALTLGLLTGCGGGGGGGGVRGGGNGPAASGPPPTPAGVAPPPSTETITGGMQEETYQGCPPEGDGGDTGLNLRKNRIDQAPDQPTPLQNLLSLTWPQGVEKARRGAWAPDNAATVAQNEGRAVTAEGYVLLVRHEGPESPNCHDAQSRDYHTWLAASAGTLSDRSASMIVEFTPRVVARNGGWTDAALLRLTGHRVRVSGWLMLDQEHPEQVGKTRGTLWEIHPVTGVQVDDNGTWQDLSAAGATLGNVPVDRQPANDGQGSFGYATPAANHRRARQPHRRRRSSS